MDILLLTSFPFALPSKRLQTYITKLSDNFGVESEMAIEFLHKESVQTSLVNILRSYSGIYLVINLINGDCYIGKAGRLGKTPEHGTMLDRLRRHLYYESGSKRIKAAIEEHGLDNFAFVVLETFSLSQNITEDFMIKRETYYQTLLTPQYNVILAAENPSGWSHTEETKQYMRDTYTQERRDWIGNLNRDKILSDSTRAKMSIAATVRFQDPEERAKVISNTSAVVVFPLDKTTSKPQEDTIPYLFNTINDAAVILGYNRKTIRKSRDSDGILTKRAPQWFVRAYNPRLDSNLTPSIPTPEQVEQGKGYLS